MITTSTRIGASAATLMLLTGAALAGPAAAKDGVLDDNPSVGEDSTSRTTTDDSAAKVAGDDSSSSSASSSSSGSSSSSSSSRARKIKRGSCTAASDWKLKAKARDGRLEVEFEVDSNVVGQRWTYRLRHDGTVMASGARTTKAPSGSFSVERRLPNAPGVHTVGATATNASTGETCRASLKI